MTEGARRERLSASTLWGGVFAVLPSRLAGFPLSNWAFALRTWIAMMAALYVAFWLQLQSAYSAAVCVGILALPTRGQAFEKALYRAAATLIGLLAALVMAALFNSARDLFILAFAAWMGLCGYVASFFDGSRAYGAVLSGYTAAIVAFTNIDTPKSTFSAGMDRCAAILIGVLAVMIVNDLLAAPDILPSLHRQLEATHRRIAAFVRTIVADRRLDAREAGDLLKAIVGFRTGIDALRVESIVGRNRASAARAVVAAMARQMEAARIVGTVLAELGDDAGKLVDAVSSQLENTTSISEALNPILVLGCAERTTSYLLVASAAQVIVTQGRRATSSLELMRMGREVSHAPRLPRLFAREASFRNGLRLFIAVLIASATLIVAGWPSLSNAMTMFAAVAGISVTAPSPQTFARNAAIAMPLAIVLVGVTEFLVLDGTDAFVLLALGWAPALFGAGLLAAGGNPRFAPIGTLMLVFMPLLLLPGNPQNYDPQFFLTNASLNIVSIILLVITVAVLLPTTDDCKRTWLLRSLREDYRTAVAEKALLYSPDEAAFRDADRESQIDALQYVSDDGPDLRDLVRRSELTSAAWSMRLALQPLRPDLEADEEARAALAAADAARLLALADRLWIRAKRAVENDLERWSWAAALSAWMALLIERSPNEIAALRAGI